MTPHAREEPFDIPKDMIMLDAMREDARAGKETRIREVGQETGPGFAVLFFTKLDQYKHIIGAAVLVILMIWWAWWTLPTMLLCGAFFYMFFQYIIRDQAAFIEDWNITTLVHRWYRVGSRALEKLKFSGGALPHHQHTSRSGRPLFVTSGKDDKGLFRIAYCMELEPKDAMIHAGKIMAMEKKVSELLGEKLQNLYMKRHIEHEARIRQFNNADKFFKKHALRGVDPSESKKTYYVLQERKMPPGGDEG